MVVHEPSPDRNPTPQVFAYIKQILQENPLAVPVVYRWLQTEMNGVKDADTVHERPAPGVLAQE